MSPMPLNESISRSGRRVVLAVMLAASALSIAACSGTVDQDLASSSGPYAGARGGVINLGSSGSSTAFNSPSVGSVEGYGGFAGRVGNPINTELALGQSDK